MLMRKRSEITAMLNRVECETSGQDRMLLVMALEYVLSDGVSTSLCLEDYLDDTRKVAEVPE